MTTRSESGRRRDDLSALAAVVRLSARGSSALGAHLNGMQSNLQATAFLLLSEREAITPSDLARKLGVFPASVSRLLRDFESRGLAAVEPDPHDRRVRRVCLTREGAVAVEAARAAVADLSREPGTASIPELLRVPASVVAPHSVQEALSALAAAGARADAAMTSGLGPVGLRSGLDRWILVVLYARSVPPHPARLAEHLCVTRQSMSTHLTRLQSKGLIRRETPSGRVDRRRVEIVLTTAGLDAAATMLDAFREHRSEIGDAVAAFVAAGSQVE